MRRVGKQDAGHRLARQGRFQLFDVRCSQHLLGNAHRAAQLDGRLGAGETLRGAVGIEAAVMAQMLIGLRAVGQQRRITAVSVFEDCAQCLGIGFATRGATFIEKPQQPWHQLGKTCPIDDEGRFLRKQQRGNGLQQRRLGDRHDAVGCQGAGIAIRRAAGNGVALQQRHLVTLAA
ncbi:hypothetical protein D3C84_909190 [compost metagenome]